MEVTSKIDSLAVNLIDAKPVLTDGSSSNEKKFNNLISSIIATNNKLANEEIEVAVPATAKLEDDVPNWVHPDYDYDPQNPRKPNMRELMEAISGKSLENLYADADGSAQAISRQASEILYGVVGSSEDPRDWLSIMKSDDILSEARKQTGTMHQPKVDIQSKYNNDGVLIEQIAVIKDNKGNTLRSLSDDIIASKETLLNFGATKESISTDLEKQINPDKFNDDLQALLKNFDNNTTSIQKIVVKVASEVIANKLSQEIPPDELAKL